MATQTALDDTAIPLSPVLPPTLENPLKFCLLLSVVFVGSIYIADSFSNQRGRNRTDIIIKRSIATFISCYISLFLLYWSGASHILNVTRTRTRTHSMYTSE
jgi:hypothetical protein